MLEVVAPKEIVQWIVVLRRETGIDGGEIVGHRPLHPSRRREVGGSLRLSSAFVAPGSGSFTESWPQEVVAPPFFLCGTIAASSEKVERLHYR